MPLLTYASPGWFSFLSATNFTKLERLHRAACLAISGCFSFSIISFLLSEPSLPHLRVILTHFTRLSNKPALRLPTSFPISGLERLRVNPTDSPGDLLHLLTRSCFLLLPPGRLSMLVFPHLLVTCLPSLCNPPFSLHAPALILPPSLAKVRRSLIWTLSHRTIWCSGQKALFLFLLEREAVAYLPTALSVALRPLFFFSAGTVCSSFFAEAYAILRALCWSRQHQQVCHSSSPFLLNDSCSVLSFIFPFISISRAGTVFSLLQFYQATLDPQTLVFPEKRRG